MYCGKKTKATSVVTGGRKTRKHENRAYRAAHVQFSDVSSLPTQAMHDCTYREQPQQKLDTKLQNVWQKAVTCPCSILQSSVSWHIFIYYSKRCYIHQLSTKKKRQIGFKQVEKTNRPPSRTGNKPTPGIGVCSTYYPWCER